LVLLMLMLLSASGISGLLSYRSVVNDLDYSINKAPQRADLTDAVASLYVPLRQPVPAGVDGARFQQQEFERAFLAAEQRILEFRRKLEAMPASPATISRTGITDALYTQLRDRMNQVRQLGGWLGDPLRREAAIRAILVELADLQWAVQQVPPPEEGLNDTLDSARSVYRSRFRMLVTATAVGVVLFLGVVRCGYRWIFVPIRQLHQGALRVAQGDFDYRLKLPAHDEMAELADAFNKMTTRFQEVATDLDWQVQQRSLQLVRSERLASVGLLAAGVAHEINNPLQIIVTASDALSDRMLELFQDEQHPEAAVVRKYLGMIQRESQRCREITTKLLDFSRGEQAARGPVDLRALVVEVIEMMQLMSKFRDRKVTFRCEQSCRIEANGTEIKQVILNIAANALEAMEPGGTLAIDISGQTDQVIVTFVDDGCGMTPDVIENLFEPFFTQKTNGKGTGLGLSITHRIVADHGGRIEVSSDGPGRGSTFRVILPRISAKSAAA
jgi:signal transduction histidine kinase